MRPKKDAGFFQGIKALRVLLNEWNWRVFGFLCVPRYTYVSKCRRRRVRYAVVSVNSYFWQDAYKKWRITPEFDFRRAFRLACVLVKTQEKCSEENRSCCSKLNRRLSPTLFSNFACKRVCQRGEGESAKQVGSLSSSQSKNHYSHLFIAIYTHLWQQQWRKGIRRSVGFGRQNSQVQTFFDGTITFPPAPHCRQDHLCNKTPVSPSLSTPR